MKYLVVLCVTLSLPITNVAVAAPAIWIIGDSTVSNYGKNSYPQTGWGQVLKEYCDDAVEVHNHAMPGRSTKSFLAEGRWAKVVDNMKSGDYLIIQFGHNDQKDYNKAVYAPARGLYQELLTKYIRDAREKGGKPLLVTPVCRLIIDKGKVINTLGEYPAAMKEVADRTNTPVVDLNGISLKKLNDLKSDEAKKLFLHFPPGTHTAFPRGAKDNSHFSNYGAKVVSGWVVLDAKRQQLEIAGHFSKDAMPARSKPDGPPVPTLANVKYGPHDRNVLDFYRAEGEGPRPLLVYIHGGGWLGGDKAGNAATIKKFLESGVSYAAINYRYSKQAPLPAPVHDAARAIQFLKSKAEPWNLRKDRFVLTGGSAGATTSMWILLHDDLADPDAEDPVRRESTRVAAAGVVYPQTSIDPPVITEWIGTLVLDHGMIPHAVGEPNKNALLKNYDAHRAMLKEFSAYNHVDRDDPPLMMEHNGKLGQPSSAGYAIHHAQFSVKMKEKSDRVGHECYLLNRYGAKQGKYKELDDFLLDQLLDTGVPTVGAVKPDDQGTFTCHARQSILHGKAITAQGKGDDTSIVRWINPADYATWELKDCESGKYRVVLSYATEEAGSRLAVEAAGSVVDVARRSTGGWGKIRDFEVGMLTLPAGAVELRVRSADGVRPMINLRRVVLIKQQ